MGTAFAACNAENTDSWSGVFAIACCDYGWDRREFAPTGINEAFLGAAFSQEILSNVSEYGVG